MASRSRDLFLTVRTEGAILPADLLQRIVEGDAELGGLTPDAYHLPKGEKLTEATSRTWNRLLGLWATFRAAAEKLPTGDLATTLTRERWLLPLFQELGYGRLLAARAIDIEGKSYPVSHGWHRTPIHLLGCRVDLDKPTQRVAGASRSSPHSLLQELLNRAPDHLWGFVSNGLRLRILRDNASLTRQAYLEFDLESMMLGESYSDFVLLWLLCHQSRVEAERPDDCWLEKWSQASKDRSVRALDQLRKGVEDAISALGRGFLAHSSNRALREKLRHGELDAQDYYRQLLRLVYRLLFLFAAEDRDLLLLPGEVHVKARDRYRRYYSTSRLRRLAERRTGTQHADLYHTLRLLMQRLGSDAGCPELALPALGSFLFSDRAMPDIGDCDIANRDLLDAVRALAVFVTNGVRRTVDYKNLGAEELGSVYESLLELHPRLNLDAATFELSAASGNERKTTGSYYTPTSLIDCLLDSALDPVLDEAAKKPNAEQTILKLKVVDPACGSGHFLIAAAHRVAKRLAAVRTGDEEPSPEATRKALRDVIGHCVYGVDVNPMAVELCKVNLWMEALGPGKPLSFLEHRIQCGNALLGATPALMDKSIPDAAFTPIEGDDHEACTKWRKVNKAERAAWEKKQGWLGFDAPWTRLGNFAQGLMTLDNLGDDSITGIRDKERLYEQAMGSSDYLDGRFLADAWCAAFVWKKDSLTEFPITGEVYRQIERNPAAFYHDKQAMAAEIRRLAAKYSFFHWHHAFPDVFGVPAKPGETENAHAEWNGGFDVVLGNPPWEHTELKEQEWFATRSPEIAAAEGDTRKRMISQLAVTDPPLFASYKEELRYAHGQRHLIRSGGRFPFCAKGRINTYAIFAETNRMLLSQTGRVGCIVPSGIATDNTTKGFFASLIATNTLVSLYDFENAVGLFEGVGHGRFKFCLLTMGGSTRPPSSQPDFFFFAHHATDLDDQHRHFSLSAEDIELINPNTRTCPIFRSKRDAEITKAIYLRVPVLIREGPPEENPWGVRFRQGLFNMTSASHLFRTGEQLEAQGFILAGNVFFRGDEKYLPLYEAKMMHQFTHRYGDYAMRPEGSLDTELPRIPSERLQDPHYAVMPRYWVAADQLPEDATARGWLLAFRDITNATNERTAIFSVLPPVGVGNNAPIANPCRVQLTESLYANTCSFVFDYAVRQKTGGTHLNFFLVEQFPVLAPDAYIEAQRPFITSRVLELTYTSWDLRAFARDSGYEGLPFRWDDERRFLLRSELDALYFHLYGIARDDVDYIMDTFPIVRRKDEQQFGEYRTKRVILEIYDAMAETERSGVPYQTRLDPPPAHPSLGMRSAASHWSPPCSRPGTATGMEAHGRA